MLSSVLWISSVINSFVKGAPGVVYFYSFSPVMLLLNCVCVFLVRISSGHSVKVFVDSKSTLNTRWFMLPTVIKRLSWYNSYFVWLCGFDYKAFHVFTTKYLHFQCKSLNKLLQLFCSLSPDKLQILSDSSPRNFHVQSTWTRLFYWPAVSGCSNVKPNRTGKCYKTIVIHDLLHFLITFINRKTSI